MNCGFCGTELPQGASNCPRCGAVTPYYYSYSGTAPNDPTIAPPPYPVAQQPPPTVYGPEPYGTTPTIPNPYTPPPPPLYAPYSAPQPTPPPFPPPPQRRGNRIGLIIGVVLLVLILVGAGILALFLRSGSQLLSPAASPTVNVTATVRAHATATAAAENPYTHSGTFAFSDSLSDNSKGHAWDENTNCSFKDGAYHALAPDPHFSDYCIAQSTNFSDFAFEVQMKVIKGDAGGIVFRVESTNPANKLYAFYIGRDGSYFLNMQNGSNYPILTKGSNPAINPGLNQPNLIAVVVQGNTIKLYVNHQPVDSVMDSSYSHGQIGVIVAPYSQPTEVAFSDAKLWTL